MISSAVNISDNGDNKVRTVKHPIDRVEYEDIDSGDTRLGPIAECWRGLDLPVSLTVVAYERDYGDPDYYRDEIHTAVTAAIAIAVLYYGIKDPRQIAALAAVGELVGDIANWLFQTEDDQVDIPRTAILDGAHIERLGAHGRKRHYHRQQNPFGDETAYATPLLYHFATKHNGLGGQYTFGFELERDPPFVETPDTVD